MTTAQRPGAVDQELVLDLGCLGAQLLPVVGGKAANLGELIGAGFPVPPGFCITTAAYHEVASGAVDVGVPDSQPEVLVERAHAAILAAPVPAAIVDAVQRAYGALGDDVPVAVRSSATAEDLPWASFAGQQDTFLNVVGTGAVLDAVRRCWASLWTARAVSYRTANGIDHAAMRLAVVVQQMIEPQVAGVLFTADPVTGHRGHTVIDASPGLGEAVVSTPTTSSSTFPGRFWNAGWGTSGWPCGHAVPVANGVGQRSARLSLREPRAGAHPSGDPDGHRGVSADRVHCVGAGIRLGRR